MQKIDYLRGFHIEYDWWYKVWRAYRYGVTMNHKDYDGLINMILKREIY